MALSDIALKLAGLIVVGIVIFNPFLFKYDYVSTPEACQTEFANSVDNINSCTNSIASCDAILTLDVNNQSQRDYCVATLGFNSNRFIWPLWSRLAIFAVIALVLFFGGRIFKLLQHSEGIEDIEINDPHDPLFMSMVREEYDRTNEDYSLDWGQNPVCHVLHRGMYGLYVVKAEGKINKYFVADLRKNAKPIIRSPCERFESMQRLLTKTSIVDICEAYLPSMNRVEAKEIVEQLRDIVPGTQPEEE